MPHPIQVLGDRDTVLAFALGGVPGRAVQTGDEARAAIDAMVRDGYEPHFAAAVSAASAPRQ